MNRTEQKDLKGFAFVRNQIVHTGVTPSLREIAREVGYGSPRSAQLMLLRLATKGLLSYSNGVINLTPQSQSAGNESTVEVPLLGSVTCGLPCLAEQVAEATLQISTRIARPGHRYFLLRARGTSMNKSGIQPDDLVLVRRQSVANEGDKVVALVDDEATIKHFHREAGVIVLKPNSTDSSHRPIVLSEEFIVQGIVIATLPASVALTNP